METVEFFDLVLPREGLRCIAMQRQGFQHFWGADNAWATEAATKVDARGVNTYFGCASFLTPGSRKADNVCAVRAFWLDLDAGPNKPYANAKAAGQALVSFCTDACLPNPLMVASGNGLHAYFVLSDDITPAEWRKTASLLKTACRIGKLEADPSRTSDISSVLRPVGTHHRKATPKLVRALNVPQVVEHSEFHDALVEYCGIEAELEDDLGPNPGYFTDSTNSDLTGRLAQQLPAWSNLIADNCAVVGEMRTTRGVMDQPTWYGVIGVLAHAEDGAAHAHEWSKGDPRYTEGETDGKLKQASGFGPTTCAKLGELRPAACATCFQLGKITSPIVLGRTPSAPIEPPAPMPSEVVEATGTDEKPEFYEWFSKSPHNGSGVLFYNKTSKDDAGEEVVTQHPVADVLFYPVGRLRNEDVSQIEWEMVLKDGNKRRFVIDGSVMGKGKDSLAAALGQQEIVARPGMERILEGYVKAYFTLLSKKADEQQSYMSFGWTEEDGFVIGDTIYLPDGTEKRVLLTGVAKSQVSAFKPVGDLDTWKDVMNRAYNAPGQEGYQFLVATAFAAPLLKLTNQVSGVTVYAHSEGSGVGKTTAQRAGLSAFGNWDELQLSDQKVTTNSLWALIGAQGSLPVMFDELTNMKNETASELVFSVSSGRSKQRMRADGELRKNNANWCTILMASGNNLLSEKLALHRGNAEAEMSRLFEFTLRNTSALTPNEAIDLFPKLLTNYGQAGRIYIRYIVEHRDEVRAKLEKVQKAMNNEAGITQTERFWSALLASVLVAVGICRKLDLLHFDLSALKTWALQRLEENRGVRIEAATPALELFGKMLSDMWQGILVTEGEGNFQRSMPARVLEKPRAPLIGRAIVPVDPKNRNEKPILLLNHVSIKEWANKNGVSAKEIFDAAVAAGWCDQNHVRYSLGKGTIEFASVTSYTRCWQIDPEKVSGAAYGGMITDRFKSLPGGKDVANGSV